MNLSWFHFSFFISPIIKKCSQKTVNLIKSAKKPPETYFKKKFQLDHVWHLSTIKCYEFHSLLGILIDSKSIFSDQIVYKIEILNEFTQIMWEIFSHNTILEAVLNWCAKNFIGLRHEKVFFERLL